MTIYNNITDVPGIKVGNAEDNQAYTGCTVLLTEEGAVCGVDVRGSAPGTLGTDGLDPVNLGEYVQGVCLTGGSVFGLEAVSGVMKYLEQQGRGESFAQATLPIVPGAVVFDLTVGESTVRPDKEMGYLAASRAKQGSFSFGNIGAGCGSTVGKVAGNGRAMKGGLGSASRTFSNGLVVGAIVVVNALGEVFNPQTGEILAGVRNDDGEIGSCLEWMIKQNGIESVAGANTTIGAVGTNANLTKVQATKVASLAQNGLARTIHPVHTMHDGDTIFSLATGGVDASVDLIGTLAADVLAEAVLIAVRSAEGIAGFPSYSDFNS